MATRSVTVAKAVVHATIVGSGTVTLPVTVSAATSANLFNVTSVPASVYTVAAGTYTTITAFITALNAATPSAGTPALSTVLSFAKTGTAKVKVTFTGGASGNKQRVTGAQGTTVVTLAKINGITSTGGADGPARLWQTSIGYTKTPKVTPASGVFWPGTPNDPLPITVENQGAHPIFIAQGHGATAVTKTTGQRVTAGGSINFSSIGTDQLYAIATTQTVKVSVSVGKR